MVIRVIGHKYPDLDSVCSAVAVADLKRKLGVDCVANICGEVGQDVRFVLDKFGVKLPDEVLDVSGDKVFLVDHSDSSQAVDGIGEAELLGIIDHHKLGDVTSECPVEIFVRAVGSTCTVVKSMYDFYGIGFSERIAGIMLCAILSDTVIFRSPTTTEEDRKVARYLADVCGVEDLEALGMEIFSVKADISGISAERLLLRDYKDFDIGGNRIGIGQIELPDLSLAVERRDEILSEMDRFRGEGGRFVVFLMLTDIMNKGTRLLCSCEDVGFRDKVFGKVEDEWYEGMMSRKKQVVPELEKFFR